MNSCAATLVGLFIIYATVITTVYCVDLKGVDVTKDELVSLTRDHFGRTDPDALFNGFFPVWATIQFLIACFFLVIAVLSFICYFLGCRTPKEARRKLVT